MKRANLIIFCVFLIFMGALYAVTLAHPAVLAPFARRLPNKAWRLLEAISFLTVYALAALGIAKRKGRSGLPHGESGSTR
jgi:hypothetical protein